MKLISKIELTVYFPNSIHKLFSNLNLIFPKFEFFPKFFQTIGSTELGVVVDEGRWVIAQVQPR